MGLLEDDLSARLATWREAGLERELRVLEGSGPIVRWKGRDYLNFCSNDYLGLASDPRLQVAAQAGSGASRLITGTLVTHLELEKELASRVGLPSALLFSSGYAANVGAISALVGKGDHVLSDRLNHASLIDGARLSGAQIHVYEHADAEHLEQLLSRVEEGRKLVVTDALFSMDGDSAPLNELRAVCDRHQASLYVDEAHSLGVVGSSGLCAERGVRPDVLIGTLGKAFGAQGAFVSGSTLLRQWLIQKARSFVFSTALSPLVVAAVRAALHVEREEKWRRETAIRHADAIRKVVGVEGEGAIVPIVYGSNARALEAAQRLRDRGILALAIRPPTVPEGTARIRLTTMATHTPEHIEVLLDALDVAANRSV